MNSDCPTCPVVGADSSPFSSCDVYTATMPKSFFATSNFMLSTADAFVFRSAGCAGVLPSTAAIASAVNMGNLLSGTGPVHQFQRRIVSRVDARDQPEPKRATWERAGRAARREYAGGVAVEKWENDFRRT